MKKLLITLISFNSLFLVSQEIDDLFLESLPEDVREDVLDKVEAKEKSEEPIYRRASVELDKDMDQTEDDSEIAKDYDYDDKVFGKKFFDTIQSSFMPVNEPNLDDSYILDYGDVLEIQLFGQEEFTDKFSISRDGSINITGLGKINVGGLKLNDANNLIQARVNSSYIGTQAYVTLSNVRDIQVLVTGNAFNPGVYTLSGNSNMLHAITMAGGIDDNGSYREIKLIRDNKVVESLDIYELIILGRNNVSTRLRTGDSILVSPAMNIVNVLSGVNRPFLYEMKDDETLQDLVKFANGISSDADLDFIQLQRLNKNNIEILSLNYEELKNYKIRNNDSLIIREYKYGTVNISGAVKIPGKYKIVDGDTLKDVLERAGGYEEYAYPFGGFLNNARSIEINKIATERLYDNYIKNLIDNAGLSGLSGTDKNLQFILRELRKVEDVGRVIAEFDLDVLNAKPELDTVLEDGDEIIIPLLTQQVYIYGEVNNQGAVKYEPNEGLAHYIEGSGGVLTSADTNIIFVVHPNGKTESLSLRNNRLAFASNMRNEIKIYPGSIIYVPRSATLANPVQTAAIWAPIVSSLALSIASVASINN
jgi:protein involved in polysaccharide export with SLBB domain